MWWTRGGPAAILSLVFVVGLVVTACSAGGDSATPSAAGTPLAGDGRLVPSSAGFESLRQVVRDPNRDPLPENEQLAELIRLGYQIVNDTPTYAGQYVGNEMSCTNCHLNAGQREKALPWVGTSVVFPQYNTRAGRLFSLEDRIRGCFLRSENGTAPPYDSRELLAISAYITWLSEGLPLGESQPWRGQNRIARENLIPIEQLDPAKGRELYAQQCASCHGLDGQGVQLGEVKPGPLWGPGSWNDGAGAARVYTLAGFIRYAMPYNAPGSLSDEEAQHIAAYIDAQDRPSFEGKADDYPGGTIPVDGVYYPQLYPENPLKGKLD